MLLAYHLREGRIDTFMSSERLRNIRSKLRLASFSHYDLFRGRARFGVRSFLFQVRNKSASAARSSSLTCAAHSFHFWRFCSSGVISLVVFRKLS